MSVIPMTNILEIWVKFVIIVMIMFTHPIVDAVNLRGDDDLDLDLGHQSNQLIEKLGDQQPWQTIPILTSAIIFIRV